MGNRDWYVSRYWKGRSAEATEAYLRSDKYLRHRARYLLADQTAEVRSN